jgi:HSP20 family protein
MRCKGRQYRHGKEVAVVMANRTPSPFFRDFVALRAGIDRLFEQSFVDPARLLLGGGARTMPLEVGETPDSVIVKALVPGVDPGNLEVTCDRTALTLHAKTEAPHAHDDWSWHLREIGYGEMTRSVTLPAQVDLDHVQTSLANGVLLMTLPKVEEARAKHIRIVPAKQVASST